MIELSRNEISEIRRCNPATVSKHKLPKLKNGKYNLLDPEVWEFVTEPTQKEWERGQKRKIQKGGNIENPDKTNLEAQKIQADIDLKLKQGRKLDLQFEIDKQGLIPSELVAIWIGYFASGIRTNFLNIGNRVARGNTKLRDNIEREISKAIEKTLEGAENGLKNEAKILTDAIPKT